MIQWKIMLKTVVIGSVVFSCWKSTSLFWIHILNWVLSSKLAEHRFYTRFAAFVANARLRTYKGLGKTNMAPIQRLLHLFYAGSTCPIFLLKMTQYAVGFSLLFKLYDRKSQDAKNPSILQGFFVTVTTQLNVCSACVVSKKKKWDWMLLGLSRKCAYFSRITCPNFVKFGRNILQKTSKWIIPKIPKSHGANCK